MADNYPQKDICIVLGNFNVVSGHDRTGYKVSASPHSSGANLSNMDTVAKEIDNILVSIRWRIPRTAGFTGVLTID